MKKVAIIGGGAAGLCVAKHLLSYTELLQPVIFEQRNAIGGTWIYEDAANENKDVFSSIYKNLRTNLPKQVMNFPDYSFPAETSSFMHHAEVRKYLEDYAAHFNVVPCIRFQTKVLLIDPLPNPQEGDWCRWKVNSQQLGCHLVDVEEFDAVVVCNGHYSVPCYPNIPGLKNYKEKKLHSHYYRDPEEFRGVKNVLVLGFGPSGRDIGLELATVCEKVYLSHKGARTVSKLPDNTQELTNVVSVTKDGSFVTESGDVIDDVDLFVICTGYSHDFPFASEKVNLEVKNHRVIRNLYKHLFFIEHPSLSIVGVPWQVAPFPLMHQQAAYIASVLAEVKTLPSRAEMELDTNNEIELRLSGGEPPRYFHKFGQRQFRYSDMLASLSGCAKNPRIIEELYNYGGMFRSTNLMNYKYMEFKKIDDELFEVVQSCP